MLRFLTVTACLLIILPHPGHCQGATTSAATAADWSKAQAKAGQPLDFDNHCKTVSPLFDVTKMSNATINSQPCRTITTSNLIDDILNDKNSNRVLISGMVLIPDASDSTAASCPNKEESCIDLEDQQFKARVNITNSYFAGRLYADNAHFISLAITYSSVGGSINLENVTLDDFLNLNEVNANSLIDLTSLKTGSYVSLRDLNVIATSPNDNPELLAPYLSVGSNLHLIGQFSMPIDLSDSSVGGNIFLENTADNKGFSTSYLNLDEATVSGSIFSQPAINSSSSAHPTALTKLVLSNATIKKQLDLSGLNAGSWQTYTTPTSIQLNLTNANVSSFTDCVGSWPTHIQIDNFSYQNFHPSQSARRPCTEFLATAEGRLTWLAGNVPLSDASFDSQPYVYLALNLDGSGSKLESNKILYRSKWRELVDTLQHITNISIYNWPAVLLSGFLFIITGDGIGWYPAIHLLIIISLSILVGLLVIRRSPGIKSSYSQAKPKYRTIWCVGACLERLLPIIELRKEFRDYFDDDQALTGKQKIFFVIYSLWGWLVGLLFAAALSGLAQNS